MTRRNWLPLTALLTAALATLACATVTNLGRPTATPLPLPEATTPANEPSDPAAEALVVEGGPTIGTPREARIAGSDLTPILEQVAVESYSSEELNAVGQALEYTVEMTETSPLLWNYGWCATTREILLDNLDKMEFEFTANGTPVPLEQFNIVDYQTSDGEWECRDFTAVVYDWPLGDEVTLETKVTFTEDLNDGQFDFPAGEKRFVYRVTVR